MFILGDLYGSSSMRVLEICQSNISMIRYRIRRRLSSKSRRVEKLVRAELLKRIPIQSEVLGDIWAITMVKNEADIIELSIRHCLNQGVDAILIADNGSTDGTKELLHKLGRELPLVVVDDPIVAYEQDAKMTALAKGAKKLGAKWIVPFDADEFWYGKDCSLGELLRNEKNSVVVYGDLYNAFPTSSEELKPHSSLAMSNSVAIKKVAFKAHRFASLCMGCNEVYRGVPRTDGIFVLHLPWRSKKQLLQKVRQGKAAVLQSSKANWAGGHWVKHGDATSDDAEKIWSNLVNWEPVNGLAWNPSGERYLVSGVANPYLVMKDSLPT